ncbi:hypothetical protein AK830_g3875 [Neonectria ditissima]|uniref:Zn(2)-C6 fungal-type domain-containing protein n=1 Tax=Neonectria ditissima TaxID=78410 RepID=A0A0P7BPK2_9HYPO|nr:hypothetical protein AK830_g3875 [Neonectria ditissima]
MAPPRLRGCCDSCTRSKLKCGGGRPSCQRCQHRGENCVYSRARRAGRPPLRSNKPRKPSPTISTDHEPPTPVPSPGNHPVDSVHCSDSEPSLPTLQDHTLPSPDSHNTMFSMQDTWNQESAPSLEFSETLDIPDLDDTMLRDLLWTNTEGFDSGSSGDAELDWNQANAPFNRVLQDADLQHDMSTDRPLSKDSENSAAAYHDRTQKTAHSRAQPTKAQALIDAIIASIAKNVEQSTISHHTREESCPSLWPQLLSKAQLLMSIVGVQGSENSFSLRLDAVLHVASTAEHVQTCVSRCATCMSQEMETSSTLALMYDWITKRIACALENPPAIQNHKLIIGDLVLTGHKGMISVYELIKYRITRAINVIRDIKSRCLSIGQHDLDELYQAVQLTFHGVENRLEALSGMIELLASEQFYSAWGST